MFALLCIMPAKKPARYFLTGRELLASLEPLSKSGFTTIVASSFSAKRMYLVRKH